MHYIHSLRKSSNRAVLATISLNHCSDVSSCWTYEHSVYYSYYCPRRSGGLYCVRLSFFSVRKITHEPLHSARWNFVWTCILTTARTLLNFNVIDQRSRSQDRIIGFFTIARWGKLFDSTITHEPLHSAWWYFVRTCTSTTSTTLLNFKVRSQGYAGFWVFFRGQYLARWSCYYSYYYSHMHSKTLWSVSGSLVLRSELSNV